MAIFWNLYTINIDSTWADYSTTNIYTWINAKIITSNSWMTLNWDNSLNSSKEIKYVILDLTRTSVRVWQIITYTDWFWLQVKLKITNKDLIEFVSKDNVIELKCEYVS